MALGNVRASMLRLLAVYDPPLSADAIERKIDEVDTYIRTIEAEFAAPAAAQAETPTAPLPASSDFDEEYEAGDEDYVDEDPDEGPFDEDDFEDEPLDETEETVLDLDETPLPPSDPSWLSARRLAFIAGGLVALLVILIAGLFLAKQMAQGSGTPAAVEAPGSGNTPAAAGGTDALESTDVPQDAAPAPAEPEPLPTTTATPPADAAAPAAGEPAATAPSTAPQAVAPPPGPPASESLVLFDGHDPSAFRSTPDNPVRFEGGSSDGFVEISSSTGANGARLIVGPGIYQRIAGRNIRIVVVARGARDNPAATMRLAYQNGNQLSGWTDLDLSGDFQSLPMRWTVPEDRTGPDGDAILIEPGIPGDQTAADIRSVTIDVLP